MESRLRDSPPAAGRFNDMILLRRSALHAKKSLPANSLRASGAFKARKKRTGAFAKSSFVFFPFLVLSFV
jgi:hypothetical protein